MKNITITIGNNTNEALDFISKELGVSKQFIVREVLNEENLGKLFKQLKNKTHYNGNKKYSFVTDEFEFDDSYL